MLNMNTRHISWLGGVVGVALAFNYRGDIVPVQGNLNLVSYWGTVATLVALLLAIAEIAYSIQATKSLQKQTAEALDAMKRVEDASMISDCISAIDVTSLAVLDERYDAALGAYQQFRKLCVRTIPKFTVSTSAATSPASPASPTSTKPTKPTNPDLSELGRIELRLLSATRVNAGAGLNKSQKHEILEMLLTVKQAVEQHNPANRN